VHADNNNKKQRAQKKIAMPSKTVVCEGVVLWHTPTQLKMPF
jgi:hypothetical protein